MKKALASSIHALRQQMRDLTNKRKGNIASNLTKSPPAPVETRVVRTLTVETKNISATGSDKSQVVSRTVCQKKMPIDTLVKSIGKDGAVIKRKLVPSRGGGGGGVGAKVPRVEVPEESCAMQERRVPGLVPTVPSKRQADDKNM